MAEGQPKPAFYFAVMLVVVGLIGVALWRFGAIGPKSAVGQFTSDELKKLKGGAEAPDNAGITTVKEYNFVASSRLPEVKGISSYKPMADRTVRFAINVWAGWSPIILANNGFKPGKVWKTPSGKDFKVELVLIDDPIAMRDAYAAGNLHVGWATLDMLPLFLEGLRKDSRVMPRVYQQVDWSNGGDGIVVREAIKTMADLRGKTVVLAQNSPSHFFILNALNAGVQPAEVQFKFTQDAFQAAAAFNADKTIAGVVSWAPDIYNLEKAKGNRMLVTTSTANKLIADVWFARADFAKDNPDVMEGIARGIFDAMSELKVQDNKAKVAKLMAAGYSIPEGDALGMLGDAHSTNYAENRDFFLNQNNPTSFERTWTTAYFLYKRINAVTDQTSFDQVMDFSVIQKLAAEAEVLDQKNEYDIQFAPASAGTVAGEKDEILTKTVVIHFFPNSWDVNKKVTRSVDGKDVQEAYDPNVVFIVDEIGKLAGQYGAARIVIEGHTDGSMKASVPKSLVQELSLNRANSVKEAVLRKFPSLQPNQFSTAGIGWDRPADPADPENHAKNRRVEIKVYPAESAPAAKQMAVAAKRSLLALRLSPPRLTRRLVGAGSVAVLVLLWWIATRGTGAEDRWISPVILPSPIEVLRSFKVLWTERALAQSIAATLKRVLIGFGLAAVIGVPLGILAGSWRVIEAAAAPVALFGRNLPVAALIPLTILWFGIDETQKVMFIFIACIPFVYADAVASITGVPDRYVETAQTLGATPLQIVTKVLVPLALPDIYNSLRHLFGLAFGYIMLAELINAEHGLGYLLMASQRRGLSEHIILILLIIGTLAYGIDRVLFFFQRGLFPYRVIED